MSELTPTPVHPFILTDPDHLTRAERPETMGQAIAWDRRRDAYARRAGLCDPCAAAAAWGHALGWSSAPHPPCEACGPLVATFPEETSHPAWRKYPRGRVSARRGKPTALVRVLGCPARVGTFYGLLGVSA
ncbi:hypothetical protein [Geodermatophilus sp. SYSU D00710]